MNTNEVMYNGTNVYNFSEVGNDREILEKFLAEINDILEKVDMPHPVNVLGEPMPYFVPRLTFHSGIGYCMVLGRGRGVFEMAGGFPEQDRGKALFKVMAKTFLDGAADLELSNRKALESGWLYNCSYDSRKAWMEYILKWLSECVPDQTELWENTITYYEKMLNNRERTFRFGYDRQSGKFVESESNSV